MEIAGAALATVIARFIETTWCCLETAIQNGVKLRFGNILKDNTVLRHDFWLYTFPILGNEVVWGIGFTMYSVIMGHLGSDAVTMWCVTVPLGCLAAFVFHLPVLAVFFIINLDEIVKLPAVYLHYKKYLWVRNLTK